MFIKKVFNRIAWERYKYQIRHNPKQFLEEKYLEFAGKPISWDNPQTLNEKILWLICYSDMSEWTRLADKIRVREYVKSKGLDDILIPLLGTWHDANDIDFDALPQKFVVKCNHDSGSAIIVDKTKGFNKRQIINKLNSALTRPYGYFSVEPHYIPIDRRILAEEYIKLDSNGLSSSPIDYKVFCYNGEPDVIWVAYNRHIGQFCECQTRDLEWNRRKDYEIADKAYRIGDADIPAPRSLKQMIEAARKLSTGFPEVRVDFYDVQGKLYFGEMTFTSDSGIISWFSDKYQISAGEKIDLNLAKLR